MKKFKKNQLFAKFGIPLLLCGLWLTLSFSQIIISEGTLSGIKETFSSKALGKSATGMLLKGEKETFKFHSSEKGLGSVTIHFDTFNRFNNDFVIFRIKEEGAKDWYYEHPYATEQFTGLPHYPFGFPIIEDSQDKEYIVEIESLAGTPTSAVAIPKSNNVLITTYQFEKNRIISDSNYLFAFLQKKIQHSLYGNYIIFTTSIYLFPLVFYLIWLLFEDRIKSESIYKNPYIILLITAILFDIFFVSNSFDLVYLLILIIWFFFLIKLPALKQLQYTFPILLLIIGPVLYLMNQEQLADKAYIWAFLLLIGSLLDDFINFSFKPNCK